MESLSEDELRAQILESLPRMHAAHRERLASYLKGAGTEKDLRKLVQTTPLLRERLAAFLRDAPEALEALLPPPRKRNRFLPYAVAGCAAFLALVPLLAQYQQQRTLVSGPSTATLTAPLAAATLRPVQRPRAVVKRVRSNHVSPTPLPVHRTIAKVAGVPAPTVRPRRAPRVHRRVANSTKQRARAVVNNYLNNVIHGNVFDAPEAAIVGPMSGTRVLSVKPSKDRVKVDVTITGPRGKYYEVFYVARDPMRIVDRFYVPAH